MAFNVIEVRGVAKYFGETRAVDGVDLTVQTGELFGLIGHNGAGKTTLFKMMLGLLPATRGDIHIDGQAVRGEAFRQVRCSIGYLPESLALYDNLSGLEIMQFFAKLKDADPASCLPLLEKMGLADAARRRVRGYSKGMRQRLGFAQALLGSPRLLFLDEPTNGLDPEGIADMRSFLRELPARSGATVLLSSHLLGEIEQVASHIGILSHGRLVLEGALAELKAGLAGEVAIQTDTPERALAIALDHGFDVVRDQHDSVIARFTPREDLRHATAALNRVLCIAGGIRIHAIAPRQRTLETLYRQAATH